MTKESENLENTLIAIYFPLTWIQYSKEIGLPVEHVLHRYGINEAQVIEKKGITLKRFSQLLVGILELTPKHEIGFEVGWQLPITAYGNLGQAILSSKTVGDAIQICISYWGLIARGFTIDIRDSKDLCILTLNLDISVEENLKRVVFEATLASLYKGCITLEPEIIEVGEVWREGEAPDYVKEIVKYISNIRFGMPSTQIRFPKSLLKKPLPMATTLGLKTALERCNDELKILGLSDKIAQKVKNILIMNKNEYPTLEDVARKLNLSQRTLRRKLKNENTNFSTLLDWVRRHDAMRLLDNFNLNISDVSIHLGYKEVANFTRAFKKWTGMTPSQYRASLQS